jgi:hypothetical protein
VSGVSESHGTEGVPRWLEAVIFLAIYLFGAAVFFRWQVMSDFDLVFGDRGDARFVSFVHEHVLDMLCDRQGPPSRKADVLINGSPKETVGKLVHFEPIAGSISRRRE